MEFKKVEITTLKEAKYNPRKRLEPSDKEYQKIKNSILEFGYVEPIIINKDNTIIGGHQRLNVLKDLGYTEVEVIQVELSKTKEKALNVALNKITGEWDADKLQDLLIDLDSEGFDISLTGFDNIDFDLDISLDDSSDEEPEEKENERIRTMNTYNLELFDYDSCSKGFWEMPIINNDNYIPKDLIGFNYAKSSDSKEYGIHFYLDDYQFERLWNNPEEYIDILKEYECILSPDFSLYMDMPMPMKIWNIYRSRLIGQYYQNQGIKVIPTISWAEAETFEFCFRGIPKGSIVSISTIGVKKDENAMAIWEDGVNEMIKQIEPSTIIVYGGKVDYDFKDVKVIYIDNKVTENMKKYQN